MFWIDYRLPQDQVTMQVVQKLRAQTSITATGCWQWDGWKNVGGYGETSYRGRYWRIHRLAYTLLKGPIPTGMDVCHKCDHAPCWNPDHLELGDQKKNSQDIVARGRNKNASKTHCPRGHSYEEHGVRHGKHQYRQCTLCLRAKERIKCGWPIELAWSMGKVPPGLRPVNVNTKVKKGGYTLKQHCSKGHPLSGENLYVTPEGRRHCRICRYSNVVKSGERVRSATV